MIKRTKIVLSSSSFDDETMELEIKLDTEVTREGEGNPIIVKAYKITKKKTRK